MQKKMFVQKGLPTAKPSYVRWLLVAAVGLILLILVTPLILSRTKSSREAARKPIPERGERGMLVREIPKAPPPFLSDLQQPAAPPKEPPMPVWPGSPPAAHESPDKAKAAPAIQAPTPAPDVATAKTAMTAPPEPARTVPPEGAPRDLSAAQKPLPPKTASAVPASQGPPPTSAPGARKVEPPGGTRLFAVQLGSFREKHNAEELKARLSRKGYSVVIKPQKHPTLGSLYVVQLEPVSDERKANTLMAQVRQESKVNPVIIRVAP